MASSFIDTPAPGEGKKSGDLHVVLQVLANMWRIDLTRDAHGLELRRGPIPDNRSKCGEPTAPALNDTSLAARAMRGSPLAMRYSTPVAPVACPATFQEHARHVRPGDDREVWPEFGLTLQECVIGAGPLAIPGGGLEKRHDARRATAVSSVVITTGNTSCLGRIDELARAWEYWRTHRDPKWTTRVVRLRCRSGFRRSV